MPSRSSSRKGRNNSCEDISNEISTDNELNMESLKQEIKRLVETKIDELFVEFSNKYSKIINANKQAVETLKTEVNLLKKKITTLEEKQEDSEALEHLNKIIIAGNAVPDATTNENCTSTVIQLIQQQLSVTISPEEILHSHRIGKKPAPQSRDNRSIAVKLSRPDLKKKIFSERKEKRINDLYINESLTPTRQKIMYVLRKLKKDPSTKISGCNSIDGKVYAWIETDNHHQTTGTAYRTSVNSLQSLDDLCKKYTNKPLSDFLKPRTDA